MEKIVSLCKRRGFVYPNSEIYGGLANAYDYGPLGVEALNNIKKVWWKNFVQDRPEIYGIDGAIISNPKVWEASGHVQSFNDALIDCKDCKERIRADHFVSDHLDQNVEGWPLEKIDQIIKDHQLLCPHCGSKNLSSPRKFNLLFKSHLGPVEDEKSIVYLRGETAQNMFLSFNNVINSFHPKLPFGLAQVGKAIRNEVTLGNFIFRTFEFEQMEIEYFVKEKDWEKYFGEWKESMWNWLISLGVREEKIRWRTHTQEELSHYSQRTEDLEYNFPFGGFKELYGLAYRTDFDLKNHTQFSGQDLRYHDLETHEKFFPHVVEPTFGVSRTLLVLLLEAYAEEKERVVLRFNSKIAPVKIAVFPLLANNDQLVKKALAVFHSIRFDFPTSWDDIGNIGKRYRRQDEIGTPWCVTIDHQTLDDDTVTIRDRDSMEQERIEVNEIKDYVKGKI